MAVTQVNLSDQMAVFVQKTNIISGDLGDVGALTTSANSNAVVAINEIELNHNNLASDVGTRALLTTTDKSNLVSAINEIELNHNNLDSDVGTRAILATNDKTDLVSAINEVKGDANGISSGLANFLRSDIADTKDGGDLNFVDNVKATFGNSSDLQIYHDISASYIVDVGTGSLNIHGTDINLRDANGNSYINMTDNGTGGTVTLRHNTATKLNTKTDGILITGELQADTLDINGAADIAGNLTVDTNALYVNATNNNVGIGTATPADKLHVYKGASGRSSFSSNTAILIEDDGPVALQFATPNTSNQQILFADPQDNVAGKIQYAHSTDTLSFEANGTERMTITGSGDVGIGRTDPQNIVGAHGGGLVVKSASGRAATTTAVAFQSSSGNNQFEQLHNGQTTFSTGSTQRLRIGSDGRIYLNTTTNFVGQGNTSTGQMFQSEGTAYFSRASGYSLGLNRNGDGELTNFSRLGTFKGSINVTNAGVTYNTTSDERLKENIETLQNGTELLKAMRAVTYDWKADGNSATGFIAQEMNEVMPQAVSEGDDGMLSMDYGRVTPIIVAALQDALKRIDELEAKQCNCGGCS